MHQHYRLANARVRLNAPCRVGRDTLQSFEGALFIGTCNTGEARESIGQLGIAPTAQLWQ